MPVAETDVIIVGAAPTGLTLARELRLAGVRTLVLERLPEPRAVAKAGGLGGRMLEMVRYRGLLDRFEAASGQPRPAPRFPFGGLHVDLTELVDPPMQALLLPQPQMESLLEKLARELGAEIRRGHEMVALRQDDGQVSVDVCGPDDAYQVSAQYLVGCDGVGSRVRQLTGIPFPGITYPEVNRLGSFSMPDALTLLDDGDYLVPGFGRLRSGYTQTANGVFAISSYTPHDLGVYTSEEENRTYDDDQPMTVAEFGDSVRRVLGADIPLGEPTRLTRFTFHARHVERYRDRRILLAGDAAHLFPSGGVAVSAGMLDAVNLGWKLAGEVKGWAPPGLLDSYHAERHLAGARTLLHTQAQVALRRGLDAAAHALRDVVAELLLDDPARRRVGALIAGADLRYPMPGADPHPLAGTFAPDLALRGSIGSVADTLHAGRPVLLDLADRADLREVTPGWHGRLDVHTAEADNRPADAILIRPDGHIAWAAGVDEPAGTARGALRESLSHWFGLPDV
ncbi:FAD-dependent monooxygenase [Mycolicibacterium komossense]|nr:FAD-dependent monooxygenase [Mycolicibacterium komossense]